MRRPSPSLLRPAAFGLTGWHEAGVTPAEIAIYKGLLSRGALKLRCYAMLGDERNPEYRGDLAAWFLANRLEDDAGHRLAVRCVKLFFDGALGLRGAAFQEPYADDPGNSGLLRVPPEYIERAARAAGRAGGEGAE
jgi:predicted amidohydrolase YtcJ